MVVSVSGMARRPASLGSMQRAEDRTAEMASVGRWEIIEQRGGIDRRVVSLK